MMNITLIDQGSACRLIFSGSLTLEYAREMEDRIIDALRRYIRFEVDLSGVTAIDICGIHLLGVLQTVASDSVQIVKTSPSVARAYDKMAALRGSWLRGCQEEAAVVGAEALVG